MVAHPDGCWVSVNVTVKGLLAAIRDTNRSRCAQCEQARVNLQADVFSGTERATNTTKNEPNLVLG